MAATQSQPAPHAVGGGVISLTALLSSTHGGALSPLRIQGQGLLHAHQIKEINHAPHLPKEAGGGAVLANFPENTLRQSAYGQHQAAGENHDLKTQRFELCHGDERGLAIRDRRGDCLL
jgi:hypothetical protein